MYLVTRDLSTDSVKYIVFYYGHTLLLLSAIGYRCDVRDYLRCGEPTAVG